MHFYIEMYGSLGVDTNRYQLGIYPKMDRAIQARFVVIEHKTANQSSIGIV